MVEKIIFNTTSIDHVHISYGEVRYTSYEELRFICRDVYGLLELAKKDNKKYDYDISNIRLILINHVTCDKGYENNIGKVVDVFCKYQHFSGTNSIIISQVAPVVATENDSTVVTKNITGIDLLQDNVYSITNYGEVYSHDGLVPQAMTENGAKVGLMCKDNVIRFFYISQLLVSTFKPELVEDTWDNEMDKLCKLFESFGFISINEYCQFEYSEAYIYPNRLGKIVYEKAMELANNKDKGDRND